MSNNIGVTKTRNPAIGHSMVSNVARVVQTGSVTVGGWQPSSFGASINVKGSTSVATTPVRILPNMIIREGASGDDVSEINRFLRRYGYMSEAQFNEMMAFGRLNQFGTATTNAVRAFQGAVNAIGVGGANTIAVNGRVGRGTWEAMEQRRLLGNDHTRSFEFNETLEQQFWSGRRGNDRRNVTITGNDITINYSPRVLVGNINLIHDFMGGREVLQSVPAGGSVYTRHIETLERGFMRWAKQAENCHVFGIGTNVTVNFKPVQVTSSFAAFDIRTILNQAGPIWVPSSAVWRTRSTPRIYFNFNGHSDEQIADFAEHEFGHVFGLFDAYDYTLTDAAIPLTNSQADIPTRALARDVMFSGVSGGVSWTSPRQLVFSYNIAMMLFAFKNNRMQNYGNTNIAIINNVVPFGEESELYFRIWPEDLGVNGWELH